MNKEDEAPNPPLEFKILQFKGAGFNRFAWFHGDTKLGTGDELESILNRFGNEGWDVIHAQIMPGVTTGIPAHVLLRRRAR